MWAVFFSIVPDIPSGPDALLVSIARSRPRTSSSEQKIFSGSSAEEFTEKVWESASVRGGTVELKFWERTSFSTEALSTFVEAIIDPLFRVGIWLDAFFKNFTVFQNCLLP